MGDGYYQTVSNTNISLCQLKICVHGISNVSTGISNNLTSELHNKEYNYGILSLVPLVIFGVAGNILVCMAISMEKRLQNVTNYFLLSLAITDLLVSLIVMPFSIAHQFTGHWIFGPIVCNLYVSSDVMMCTSSILHLCTISLERYIAIRYPLKTRNRSKRIVVMKIILVWTLASAITSPITVLGFLDESNVYSADQCVLNNDHFIVYGSTLAFFIPLAIMIWSYSLTIHLLNKQAKRCSSEDANGEGGKLIRRSTGRYRDRAPPPTLAAGMRSHSFPQQKKASGKKYFVNFKNSPDLSSRGSASSDSPNININGGRLLDYKKLTVNHSRTQSDSTEYIDTALSDEERERQLSLCHRWKENASNRKYSWRPGDKFQRQNSAQDKSKRNNLRARAASIFSQTKDDAHTAQVKNEQKASKVLGVVFVIFVICWAPFFVVNILTALCKACYFEPALITAFVWLGYVSSTLNPIIYTIFNRTFMKTFIRLLKCEYQYLVRPKQRMYTGSIISCNGLLQAPLHVSIPSPQTSCNYDESTLC